VLQFRTHITAENNSSLLQLDKPPPADPKTQIPSPEQ